MRLFQRFSYRIPKDGPTAPQVLQRVREVVRAIRDDEQPIRFLFEDSISSPSSATELACRDFAELEPFRSDVVFNGPGVFGDLRGLPALSNLPDCWEQANRDGHTGFVDPDVLAAIVAGVPKRYSFDYVTLLFDDLDWYGTGGRPEPPALQRFPWQEPTPRSFSRPSRLLTPSIAVGSHLDKGRRLVPLAAAVGIDTPPSDAPHLPPLPTKVEDLLGRLGKREAPGLQIVLSDEELDRLREALPKAAAIVEPVLANVQGELRGVKLPHDLPPDPPLAEGDAAAVHRHLAAAMQPLGYTLRTGGGKREATFVRALPSHNLARVQFHVSTSLATLLSPACPMVAASFGYGGPMWFHLIPFSVTPRRQAQRYPMADRETADRVAQNAAAVVTYLEGELVPALDRLYGPAPAWYPGA